MRSTSALPFAILFAILTAATVTTAWAGTTGNGWSRPTSTPYVFCYGGNPNVEYFSRVFPLASSATNDVANEGVAFTHYLSGEGYRTSGGQCRTAPTEAGAIADKQTNESTFQSAEYRRKVVETEWAGS